MMIMINQNNIYLGGIKNDEMAAKFYDKVAIISKGVNAQTNFSYNSSQISEILHEFDFNFSLKRQKPQIPEKIYNNKITLNISSMN